MSETFRGSGEIFSLNGLHFLYQLHQEATQKLVDHFWIDKRGCEEGMLLVAHNDAIALAFGRFDDWRFIARGQLLVWGLNGELLNNTDQQLRLNSRNVVNA